ncbi:hypothetical protein LVJ94_17365 [Pendulispora rubella]|uniref:DUF6817 domain-containing protein n=1 Tax=Pendulispora rubella TaxID=2741070 RepID=A0ABZ2LDL9_9BACT
MSSAELIACWSNADERHRRERTDRVQGYQCAAELKRLILLIPQANQTAATLDRTNGYASVHEVSDRRAGRGHNKEMDRRAFMQLVSYITILGCGGSSTDEPDDGEATEGSVQALIEQRIAENIDADAFVSVLNTNPNILRRAPTVAMSYRTALRDSAALAYFNERRVQALKRLRVADLEPRLKMFMLDLQLEKVDHSVAMCMDHFIGVYELLRQWGHPDEVAFVGLFHAIYGTEFNVIDLLDYNAAGDRARVQRMVGEKTDRWIVLYSLMTACPFARGTRDAGAPVREVEFFEPAHGISNALSEEDFSTLAELQVANAYEPYLATGKTGELGIARKLTWLREYLSTGGRRAIDNVLAAFPSGSDAEMGCP